MIARMKTAYALLLPFALGSCATMPPPAGADGIARASLHQHIYVDGLRVTPLAVLEDSRCPMNARCVWAGRTRLSVRIDLGSRSETREIASDQPIQVADGTLSLVEVQPDKMAGEQAKPKKYRFGFTFAGGI
ncbi:MAG: hypothetical protein P0Y56_02500 [Candidatus Andeanibacterium colombiense]|uniref:Lipoprotein n=1 Tax=Candidatus Andeanibacterium colombiense TaxID=3121345 RepID=A0AAJ5X7A8_9SPHN|nr:MAG: hypothetical protein P0Y56_02500 [Sphingomonadaceae bacterium]